MVRKAIVSKNYCSVYATRIANIWLYLNMYERRKDANPSTVVLNLVGIVGTCEAQGLRSIVRSFATFESVAPGNEHRCY